MAAAVFSIDPEVLKRYSNTLEERAERVAQAGSHIARLNGFNLNAFGIAAGQALAIPTRVALADLATKLGSAADNANSAAKKVRIASKALRETDEDNGRIFDRIEQ